MMDVEMKELELIAQLAPRLMGMVDGGYGLEKLQLTSRTAWIKLYTRQSTPASISRRSWKRWVSPSAPLYWTDRGWIYLSPAHGLLMDVATPWYVEGKYDLVPYDGRHSDKVLLTLEDMHTRVLRALAEAEQSLVARRDRVARVEALASE